MIWKVCLNTWMTHVLVLRTDKHISAIWRLFSPIWQPMVSPLISKKAFCNPFLGNSWPHDFSSRSGPHADHAAEIKLCPPPQDIKQLQLFLGIFIQMRTSLAPFNWSPERRSQKIGVDHLCTGGFPECKTPPGSSGATPASCPNSSAFSGHWRLRYPHRRGHATKIWRPLAAPWIFLL